MIYILAFILECTSMDIVTRYNTNREIEFYYTGQHENNG